MPSSCQEIRLALAQCLQDSDCIMVQRHQPHECLRPPLSNELPTKCQQLLKGLSDCKRGMIDMRKRFRGNQPIALSREVDAETGKVTEKREAVGQLYAGKSAFQTGMDKTNEAVSPNEDP